MLISIPTIQIPTYWEMIKFAAVKAAKIEEKDISSYSLGLLYSIMKEDIQCLLSYGDDQKINRMLLIYFEQDILLEAKILWIHTLYSFVPADDQAFNNDAKILFDYCQKKECSYIKMTTSNKRVMQVASAFNFTEVSKNYSLKL